MGVKFVKRTSARESRNSPAGEKRLLMLTCKLTHSLLY